MHGRKRAHHEQDNNRLERPLELKLPFISNHVLGSQLNVTYY